MSTARTARRVLIRTSGLLVLSAFIVGLSSSPLRPCFSHPSHGSAPGPTELAGDHHGSLDHASHHAPVGEGSAPAQGHVGCSCLGQCSLEQAPYLARADAPHLALVPAAPKTLVAPSGRDLVEQEQGRVSPARAPPVVV